MIRMSIAWCMLDVRLSLENERRLMNACCTLDVRLCVVSILMICIAQRRPGIYSYIAILRLKKVAKRYIHSA